MDPSTLVTDGWVRENIEQAIVTEEQFETNKLILPLEPEADGVYLDAWEEITSGAG
jgi:hypothetical protein